MTILAAIVRPDTAIAWTDSQVFDNCGDPIGHCNKMHLIGRGPVVAMASGWGRLASLGVAALQDGEDVDDAAARVSVGLRRAAPQVIAACKGQECDFARQHFSILGWSRGSSRFLGYRLDGSSFFTPILFTRIAWPEPPGFEGFEPRADADVTEFATRQIEILREGVPAASGGDLQLMHLGERGASLKIFRDFATSPQPEPEFSS